MAEFTTLNIIVAIVGAGGATMREAVRPLRIGPNGVYCVAYKGSAVAVKPVSGIKGEGLARAERIPLDQTRPAKRSDLPALARQTDAEPARQTKAKGDRKAA